MAYRLPEVELIDPEEGHGVYQTLSWLLGWPEGYRGGLVPPLPLHATIKRGNTMTADHLDDDQASLIPSSALHCHSSDPPFTSRPHQGPSAPQTGERVKETTAIRERAAGAAQRLFDIVPGLLRHRGTGPSRAAARIRRIVLALTRFPSPAGSPWRRIGAHRCPAQRVRW